ncbi:hypothetical protein JZ751_003749 [Albula glossodonta]|uniref:PX domain-containing protein n=1 Tax=Albula glossodonta TaxID=121402 RepID=A0A8T2P5A5_9TELE|nr:hypothetical protein JZ751_003749 [Albula glossodonta]
MASAVFEGTSLVNMFVKDCWVNGIRRLIISQRGEEEEFFEIRTEWSDRNILYLHRSYSDLGRLFKRLVESFPEDRRDLSKSPLIEAWLPSCALQHRATASCPSVVQLHTARQGGGRHRVDVSQIVFSLTSPHLSHVPGKRDDLGLMSSGLVKIKEASDIEVRLNEVERLLKNAINMPWKYSRSEVVLTFFERSPLDQVLKNDNVHKIQPCFQSPVKISEIMRSNGFCLANTETIVYDESLPPEKERPSSTDSAEHPFENGEEFLAGEPDNSDDDPEAYVTNLSYYHLVPFETDILE